MRGPQSEADADEVALHAAQEAYQIVASGYMAALQTPGLPPHIRAELQRGRKAAMMAAWAQPGGEPCIQNSSGVGSQPKRMFRVDEQQGGGPGALYREAERAASALAVALPSDDLLRLSCQALAQALRRRLAEAQPPVVQPAGVVVPLRRPSGPPARRAARRPPVPAR